MRILKKHRNLIRIMVAVLVVIISACMLIPVTTVTVHAETAEGGGWLKDTDAYNDLYGGNHTELVTERSSTDTGSGVVMEFLEQQIGHLIYFLSAGILNAVYAVTGTSAANFSIESIVYGKIAQPHGQSNLFGFDLTSGNYYGIVGATVYNLLRGIAYSGIFIMFLFLLAKNLFDNTPKAREDLKDGISGSIIAMVLLGLMPYLIELMIFLRDEILLTIADGERTEASGQTLLNAVNSMYNDSSNNALIGAILFAAVALGVVFYAKDYISIALQQTMLFALFPIFNLMGMGKKKFLSDWANSFVANLFVPIIDTIILWLPYKVMANHNTGESYSIVEILVIVMMIWGSRTVRQEMLKLFGTLTSSPAGRGIGGLGQMVQMARLGSQMAGKAGGTVAGAAMSIAGSAAGGSGGSGSDVDFGSANETADMSQIGNSIMNDDSLSRQLEGTEEKPNNINDTMDREYAIGDADDTGDDENADVSTKDDGIISGISDDGSAEESSTDEAEDVGAPETDMVASDDETDIGQADETGASQNAQPMDEPVQNAPMTRTDTEQAEADASQNVQPIDETAQTTAVQTATDTATAPSKMEDFERSRLQNLSNLDRANEESMKYEEMSREASRDLRKFDAGEDISGKGMSKDFAGQVKEHRASLAAVDKDIAAVNKDIENENRNWESNKLNGGNETQHNERLAQYNNKMEQLNQTRSNAVNALDMDRKKIVEHKETADSRAVTASKNIEGYQKREAKFAEAASQHGMSGKTYASAGEFETATQTRDMRVKAMLEKAKTNNVTNADLKGFTPAQKQQVAEIQSTRMRNQAIRSIAHQAGSMAVNHAVNKAVERNERIVGAAASVVTASMMAYGGEEASMTGMQLGNYAGRAIAGRTVSRPVRGAMSTANTVGGMYRQYGSAFKNPSSTGTPSKPSNRTYDAAAQSSPAGTQKKQQTGYEEPQTSTREHHSSSGGSAAEASRRASRNVGQQ